MGRRAGGETTQGDIGQGVVVQAGEVHVGDGLAAEDGVDPERGQQIGFRPGGVALGIIGGVAHQQDVAGDRGPTLGRVGQERADGLWFGQTVVEVIVDALEGHGQGT